MSLNLPKEALQEIYDIKSLINCFSLDPSFSIFKKKLDYFKDLSNKLNYYKNNDKIRKKIAFKGQRKYFHLLELLILSRKILLESTHYQLMLIFLLKKINPLIQVKS